MVKRQQQVTYCGSGDWFSFGSASKPGGVLQSAVPKIAAMTHTPVEGRPRDAAAMRWQTDGAGEICGGGGGCGGGALEEQMLRCCMSGDKEQWRALLPLAASGCFQVNWRDKSGRTALSYAASSGNTEAVGKLLQCRAIDANLADNDGNTPLIYAAAMGYDGALAILLSCPSVNIDQANVNGCTALIKASMSGHAGAVKMLLDAGASMEVRDCRRQLTAAEWARFCGSASSYRLLSSCAYARGRSASHPSLHLDTSQHGGGGRRRASAATAAASAARKPTRVSLLRNRSVSFDEMTEPPTTTTAATRRWTERSGDALSSLARRIRESLLFKGKRRSSSPPPAAMTSPSADKLRPGAPAFGQYASAPSIPLLLAMPSVGELQRVSPVATDYDPRTVQAELVKWSLKQFGCDREFKMHVLKSSLPRIEITAATDDESREPRGRRQQRSPPPAVATERRVADGRGGRTSAAAAHHRRRTSDPAPWRCVQSDAKKGSGGGSGGGGQRSSRAREYGSSPVDQMRHAASCR